MNTFLGPEPVAIPMSSFTTGSHDLDKALVYDDTAGHYVLMSTEVAHAEVLIAKRSTRKAWAIRIAVLLLLCAVSAILGFIASKGGDSTRTALQRLTGKTSEAIITTATPVKTPVPASAPAVTALPLPPIVAASDSAALVPLIASSATFAPVTAPAASQRVLAAVLTPPAPLASASVAPPPAAVVQAPIAAPVAAKPGPTPPPVAPPVKKPVIAAKPVVPKEVVKSTPPVTKVTSVKVSPRAAPEPTPDPPKAAPVAEAAPPKPSPAQIGVQRVTAQGVYYFDGATNKLFAPGATLPNGEKVIDVDETSATYATDKGVRQLRSSKP